MQLFNIQTKLRAAKQKTWYPPEGKLVSDINKVTLYLYFNNWYNYLQFFALKAWVRLEGAEHGREAALRKELMRQEKLEQLADKFTRKAGLREAWLGDMTHILGELDKGKGMHAVDAALKRHEAISADIQAGVRGVINQSIL